MEQVQGSGAAPMTGGAGDGDVSKVQPVVTSPSSSEVTTETPTAGERTVKLDDHRRALDGLMQQKQRAQKLEAELEALRVEKLKGEQNYKQLWERSEENLKEEKAKRQNLHEGLITGEKWNSVEKELIKAGVRSDAMKIMRSLELSGVEAEFTTQGRVIVHGAESFVDAMKRENPFFFQTTGAPTINAGGTTSVPVGPVTSAQVIEAERASQTDPSKRSNYLALYKRFQDQKTGSK